MSLQNRWILGRSKTQIKQDFLGMKKPKDFGEGFGKLQKWKSGRLPKGGT